MNDTELRLRGGIKPQKCAVEGCNEVPSERLERIREFVWCKPHSDSVKYRIAQCDYKDFVGKLQEQLGKEIIPRFLTPLTKVEDRCCCVSRCSCHPVTSFSFEPYKVPGYIAVCNAHLFALNYTTKRLNPQRVIAEMERARKGKHADEHVYEIREAIVDSCGKYSGDKNYIEKVCQDLQRRRTPLLAHWVKDWNKNYGVGLQNWDWLVAYKANKLIKSKIQKYISAVCNPRTSSRPRD